MGSADSSAAILSKPRRFKMRQTAAGETPVSAAIYPPSGAMAHGFDCATIGEGVGRFRLRGRDDMSCSLATSSAVKRVYDLCVVLGQTPAASAAAFGVCPLSIDRTSRTRLN